MQKTLSIVTVCYNSVDTINSTFSCVRKIKKDFDNIEYIVIDGNSTDGTLELIKLQSDFIDKYISEDDTGIYNAMNKGLKLAGGEYISYLNSDDEYLYDNFEPFFEELKNGKFDYIYGNILRNEKRRKVEVKPISIKRAKKYGFITPGLTQPASFIKRKVYDEIGGFDEQFGIAGDTDFLTRMLISGKYRGRHIDKPINLFNTTGVSNKLSNYREHKLMRDKYNINYFKFYRFIIENIIKRLIYKSFKKFITS